MDFHIEMLAGKALVIKLFQPVKQVHITGTEKKMKILLRFYIEY